jgi:hypothetical protein
VNDNSNNNNNNNNKIKKKFHFLKVNNFSVLLMCKLTLRYRATSVDSTLARPKEEDMAGPSHAL